MIGKLLNNVWPGSRLATDDERGVTLAETLVALAIFGLVAVVFLTGLATSSKAVMVSQERVAAESLAKSQMESIKSDSYSVSGNYSKTDIPIDLSDQGYDIDWPPDVQELSSGLQKVVIIVMHNGEAILQLEDYKVDR